MEDALHVLCGTVTATSTSRTSTRTATRWSRTGTTSTTIGTTTTRLSAMQLAHFSPTFLVGEFCFESCPDQPPRFRPISSSLIERSIYFLSSSDFDSHIIMTSSFKASSLRIASFTYGCFSCGKRKLAAAMASIISTNNESILAPNECLCAFGI